MWEEQFEDKFSSLKNWIEKRGLVGTKQALKDFITKTIEQEKIKLLDEFISGHRCHSCGKRCECENGD